MKSNHYTVCVFFLAALLTIGCVNRYQQQLERGQQLYQQGQLEPALQAYETALAADPEGVEAQLKIPLLRQELLRARSEQARAQLRAGNPMGALDIAQQTQQRLPGEPGVDALMQEVSSQSEARADDLATQRSFEQAIALYQHIVAVDPGSRGRVTGKITDSRRAISTDLQAQAAARHTQGDFQGALQLYARARDLLPQNERGAVEARELDVRRDWSAAIAKEGEASLQAKRYENALRSFERANELLPPQEHGPLERRALEARHQWSNSIAKEAEAALRARRYDEAIRRFDEARQLLPEGERARLDQRILDARRSWSKGIAKEGDRLRSQKDFANAIEQYAAAARQLPENERGALDKRILDTRRSWSKHLAGQAKEAGKRQEFERSIQLYSEAIAKLPENEQASLMTRLNATRVVWAESIAKEAEAALAVEDFQSAIQRYDEAIAKLPVAQQGEMKARQDNVHAVWASALLRDADALEQQGLQGGALLLAIRAGQHHASPQVATARAGIRQRLIEQHRYLVRPQSGQWEVSDIAALAQLTRGAPSREFELSTARQDPRTPRAWLRLTVAPVQIDTQISTAEQSVRYEAGVQRLENPEYMKAKELLDQLLIDRDSLQPRLDRLVGRRDKLRARLDSMPPAAVPAPQHELPPEEPRQTQQRRARRGEDADIDLDEALPSDSNVEALRAELQLRLKKVKRRLRNVRDELKQIKDEVQQQRAHLQQLPTVLEEAQYGDHVYTIETHRVHASLHLSAVLEPTTPSRAMIAADETFSLNYEDTTHLAQRVIGLAADPLQLPARADVNAELKGQSQARLKQLLLDGYHQHRQRYLDEARQTTDTTTQLDRLVIHAMLDLDAVPADVQRSLVQLSGVNNILDELRR